jgi:hypothetical protein
MSSCSSTRLRRSRRGRWAGIRKPQVANVGPARPRPPDPAKEICRGGESLGYLHVFVLSRRKAGCRVLA